MVQPDREPIFTLRTIRRLASAVGVPVIEESLIQAGKAGSLSHTKDQELRLEVQKNLTPETKKIIIAHLLAHQALGHTRSPEGFGVTWAISANNSCIGQQKVNSIILAQEAGAKAWAAFLLGKDDEARNILATYMNISLAEALGVTVSIVRTYQASSNIVAGFPEHPRQWAERIRNPHGLRLIK